MVFLGIESSCDECAAALVADGKTIVSNVVVSQIKQHSHYAGIVPELASRLHAEWILEVVQRALADGACRLSDLDGVAVSNRPGLVGSLLVGLSFAKALAWSSGLPLLAVDHILAHMYAVQLDQSVPYPHLCLLVSGGHTLIALLRAYNQVEVLGSTVDDACGEAFDKVAKHYQLGYPGGPAIDQLATVGDEHAYNFPQAKLKARPLGRPLDMSYSGLKTAAILQSDRFLRPNSSANLANLAASFQRAAITTLLLRLEKAVQLTGVRRVIIGGGVAANSYLRRMLLLRQDLQIHLPPLGLCLDNAAMVAGIGYHYAQQGHFSGLSERVYSRSEAFRSRQKT